METVGLEKVLGIQEITENCIVRGDGGISIGFAINLPPLYSQDSEKVLEINKSFESILNELPPYSVWHALDFVYKSNYEIPRDKEIKNFVDSENLKYFQSRGLLNHAQYVFITFPNYHFVKKNSGNIPVITRKDWITKKPFKKKLSNMLWSKLWLIQVRGYSLKNNFI